MHITPNAHIYWPKNSLPIITLASGVCIKLLDNYFMQYFNRCLWAYEWSRQAQATRLHPADIPEHNRRPIINSRPRKNTRLGMVLMAVSTGADMSAADLCDPLHSLQPRLRSVPRRATHPKLQPAPRRRARRVTSLLFIKAELSSSTVGLKERMRRDRDKARYLLSVYVVPTVRS